VASKDQKAFVKGLKLVYKASNKSVAADKLLKLSGKWGDK
jgi:transposase-like protein